MFVPHHLHPCDIDSVVQESDGIKLVLPHRKDITISLLEVKEAKKLKEKLNVLIPKEKEKREQRKIERAR